MPFLAAVVYLSWANLLNSFALVARGRRTLSVAYFCGGGLGGLLGLVQFRALFGAEQKFGGPNAAVWLAALFGLVSLSLAIKSLADLKKVPDHANPSSLGLGSVVISALTSILICGAVADHALFCAGSRLAVLDPRAMEVRDMPCDGLAIARVDDGGNARYRCAHSMVWGEFSDAPFLPWPSYSEGTSSQLQAAIARVRAQAVRLE